MQSRYDTYMEMHLHAANTHATQPNLNPTKGNTLPGHTHTHEPFVQVEERCALGGVGHF